MPHPLDIPPERVAEYDALLSLLMAHAVPDDPDVPEVADRVARGCLQDGHLWRSMELESREELRRLMETSFPSLAADNAQDMRWKKYLYKRLCGWSGFHD